MFAATVELGLLVDGSWGSMVLRKAGMAWRSRLYWSNIACGDGSVAVVGDGGVVGWSWAGLVEMALIGGAGWQFVSSGSGVDDGGGGVCAKLMDAGGCWAVRRHLQSSRVAWHVKPGGVVRCTVQCWWRLLWSCCRSWVTSC